MEYRALPGGKSVPSSLELAAYKRPPSYSDSFYVVKQTASHPTFEFLDLAATTAATANPTKPLAPPPPSSIPTVPINDQTSQNPNTFVPIALSFLFHISLISLFESLFFYYFISRSEDKGILTTVTNILDEITTTCPWPANQTIIFRDIFQLLVNTTALSTAAAKATESRAAYNHRIFVQSWMYVVAIGSTALLAFAAAVWRKQLTRALVRRIVSENLGLVALLGAYEFVFFKTIIYNYDSISVLEIEEYAVNTLQSQCLL